MYLLVGKLEMMIMMNVDGVVIVEAGAGAGAGAEMQIRRR